MSHAVGDMEGAAGVSGGSLVQQIMPNYLMSFQQSLGSKKLRPLPFTCPGSSPFFQAGIPFNYILIVQRENANQNL